MPNLVYNPRDPRDLLGQRIAPGDVVAWGTTYGRSAALCIALIEKIRYTQKGLGGRPARECSQDVADDYKLVLKPLKSTGRISTEEYVPGGYINPDTGNLSYWRKRPEGAKPKTVTLVKNVVKLGLTLEEVGALIDDSA